MNEAQARHDYIDPKLKAKGWGSRDSRIIVEHPISKGRIGITGHRAKPIIADYVLEYKSKKIAIIEAKKSSFPATEGLEQAKEYGKLLDIDFVYSTNGIEIYEFSLKTGKGKIVSEFQTPQELWEKIFSDHDKWKQIFATILFAKSGGRTLRYYQENAVDRALEAVAEGKKRILLTLATGTGKTYISAQFAYKLFEAKWNLQGEQKRRLRILFLADRNILASQALNDFDVFQDDAKIRIKPSELKRHNYQVPKNGNVFFTIFQTLIGEKGNERFFEKYPANFFDLVIIDECHRGGANNESTWREILDYFAPAVQLGLTATPKRIDNVDTYEYFGTPVYQYSLKEGVNDGFLTPFRVKKIQTKLDEYIWQPDDEILEGKIDEHRVYEEKDHNISIEIKEREQQRVRIMFENINKDEKTIVFCANQKHALYIRDLINKYKENSNPDYCVRVTADDGTRGETFLKQFQDNENLVPTILTTSQKLSTGVDARNIRNIVLMRPINSIIEFKQIVGRGTRVFEGKHYFTIIDFVKAYQHFADPEWDGEPEDQTTILCDGDKMSTPNSCAVCKSLPCVCEKSQCEVCGEYKCMCEKKSIIKIKLGGNKIEFDYLMSTSFYAPDGAPITSEQFLKNLFGKLPEFFKDENELRHIWSNPDTRAAFLKSLNELGYDEAQLEELKKIINAENSDLFDVFEYVAFAVKPVSREYRIKKALALLDAKNFDQNTQDFLKFVLENYKKDGYKTLSNDKIATLLELKYGGIHEAQKKLGRMKYIRSSFYSVQEMLYA